MPRRRMRSGLESDPVAETTALQDGTSGDAVQSEPQAWIFYCKYSSFRIVGDGYDVSFVHNRAVVTDEKVKDWLCSQSIFGGTSPHFSDARGGSPVYWLGGYPQWYIDKIRERNEQLILDPSDINETPLT